jgi:hypothetical protein
VRRRAGAEPRSSRKIAQLGGWKRGEKRASRGGLAQLWARGLPGAARPRDRCAACASGQATQRRAGRAERRSGGGARAGRVPRGGRRPRHFSRAVKVTVG